MNEQRDKFNEKFAIGQAVHLMLDDGTFVDTYIASAARSLDDGRAVVKVANKRGSWYVSRIFPRYADC